MADTSIRRCGPSSSSTPPRGDWWRLRVERFADGTTIIADEPVTGCNPEHAQPRDEDADKVWLTTDEARWLHRALGEVLAEAGVEVVNV